MGSVAELSDVSLRARRRVAWRLLPFLFILYIIAFLDRVNVGYAGLEMARDLAFSDRVFGLGAGIFSIGYFIFEIPGALIVERWSARRWIARILITWGAVTILVAAVHTPRQFYAARFLLGVAEAGFFPGLLVYLTHWFRHEDRAKAGAMFMAAIPMSNILGAPFAGWILSEHWLGWPGWRWLFVVEGIPAVLFGVATLWFLDGLACGGEVAAAGREGMAERRVAERKGSESAGAAMHGVAGAAAAGGGAADAGLFFGDHRDLWIHHLVSDDREACDRAAERGSNAAVSAALRRGIWRDAAERLAFRPHGRAAVAHRISFVFRRGGAGPDAAGAGKSASQFCGDDRGGGVHDGVHAELLGAADRVADGVGGRGVDWVHQLGGEPGRVRGAIFYRIFADGDRFLCAGPGIFAGVHGTGGRSDIVRAQAGESGDEVGCQSGEAVMRGEKWLRDSSGYSQGAARY